MKPGKPQMRKASIMITAAELLPTGAGAGPLATEVTTQGALANLGEIAVAVRRCNLHVPDSYFQSLVAQAGQGFADDSDTGLAISAANEAAYDAFDAMSKAERAAKCREIAKSHPDFEKWEWAK